MSTIKASNLQNGSSSSVNIALNTDGSATFAQMPVGPFYYAMRNKIINGAMDIDQRNSGGSITINGNFAYPVDRVQCGGIAASGTFTAQQSSTSVSGFSKSLVCLTGTADASIAAGDYYFPYLHKIEGLNIADLAWGTSAAKPITISFWVRSNVTGNYPVAVRNGATDRSYVTTIAVSVANTFELKSVTIPGDVSGTWLTDTGIGIHLSIGVVAGTTYQTTTNAWASGNFYSAAGCANWMSANGNTFYITGVQLEIGSVATPFERRNYQQELAMCQRYYIQNASVNGIWINNTQFRQIYQMPVTMRTNPTVTIIEPNAYHEWWNLAAYTGVSGISTVAAIRSVDFTLTSSSNRGRSYGDPSLIGSNSVGISAEL